MIPVKLTLKNFRCYSFGEIDFTKFNTAVIVGHQAGNASVSNAVGKTAIFDSIEYVLFNISRSKLDNLINDNASEMSVSLEFTQDDVSYKITRERTKKSSDISLFVKENDSWKDLSSRRSGDTDESILKLIRLDYSVFKTTAYFSQKDDFSLALITPEKRKALLKDILKIGAYSKYEKIAKDEFSLLEKSYEELKIKSKILNSSLSAESDLLSLKAKNTLEFEKNSKDEQELNLNISKVSNRINSVKEKLSNIKNDNHQAIKKSAELTSQLFSYKKEFDTISLAKENQLKLGKKLSSELETLKPLEIQEILESDVSYLDDLKNEIAQKKFEINSLKLKSNSFKIPNAESDTCNVCGSKLDLEHLLKEKSNILNEKQKIKDLIISLEKEILNKEEKLKLLNNKLQDVKNKNIENDLRLKKSSDLKVTLGIAKEKYSSIKESFLSLEKKILITQKDLEELPSIDSLKESISFYDKELSELEDSYSKLIIQNKSLQNNTITINSALAIINSKLLDIEKSKQELKILQEKQDELNSDLIVYPYVIQAFSSTGIPSIIISSILDSLQEESNLILNKIHPGLQLQFITEKERKKDKELEDKLLIVYFSHSKERSYEELSGAQSIAVQFALKLGLAFLLQKQSNYNFGLLLLDEVDSPLDKQSISYFTEVLKSFQDTFKILTITHNDYSKEKLTNQIVVEQDKSKMITTIKEN